MGKKTLYECKSGSDITSYVEHHPETREIKLCSGSHRKAKGPKPGSAVWPDHGSKPLPLGTLKSVIKMLVAIGLGSFVIAIVL
jgi:hypothetical protein